MKPDRLHMMKLINCYPTLCGAGNRVMSEAPEFRSVRV